MSIAERAPGGSAERSFKDAPDLIGGLDPQTTARMLAVACDLTIVLDGAGRVRDIAFGNEDIAAEPLRAWIGRPFAETLAEDSRDKFADLLAEVAAGRQTRWRHLNHVLPKGGELPVRYRGVKLGSDRTVLLGRELRAVAGLQQRLTLAELAMARDYQRISSAEGRYRMMFQTSSEAVLIADPAGLRVLEANPAMVALSGRKARDLAGMPVLDMMDEASRETAETLLAAVRLTARGEDVTVRIAGRPEDLRLSALLFRQDNAVRILVRLVPASGLVASPETAPFGIVSVVESMPDGFVLMGPDRRIRMANVAFLEAAQLSIPEQARGERIDRWLGRTDVDIDVIMTALRERGAVRQFATVLRGEYGAREEVEVSAVMVDDGPDACIGFTLRLSGARLPAPGAPDAPLLASKLTDLVGQVPLKILVRDTTDQVEKRCIETALQLTRNNRAGAAEMLGLSRQSLYAKLRRFGLIGEDEVDDGVS